MKSFFIVVVLMLRNGGAQTRIGGAPRAKESQPPHYSKFVLIMIYNHLFVSSEQLQIIYC